MIDDITKIRAPFTAEQVMQLNKFQQSGFFHPFTCGNPLKTDADHPDRGVLIATEEGWRCPYCSYKQSWAHEFMADPLVQQSMAEFEKLAAMKKSFGESFGS